MIRQKTGVELAKNELAQAEAIENYSRIVGFKLSGKLREYSETYEHFRAYLNQHGLELSGDNIRPLGAKPEEAKGQGYIGQDTIFAIKGTLLEKLCDRYNPLESPKHNQFPELKDYQPTEQHSSAAGH